MNPRQPRIKFGTLFHPCAEIQNDFRAFDLTQNLILYILFIIWELGIVRIFWNRLISIPLRRIGCRIKGIVTTRCETDILHENFFLIENFVVVRQSLFSLYENQIFLLFSDIICRMNRLRIFVYIYVPLWIFRVFSHVVCGLRTLTIHIKVQKSAIY